MPRKSAQIALGGLCAALSVVLMLASGLLPFSTYALPALAGVVLLPLAVEFGPGTAALAYAAGALLSLFLVPDREASLMYAAFFGYYPILRFWLEKIRSRFWKTALKLLVFNAAVFFVYGLLVFLYGVAFVFGRLSWWLLMLPFIANGLFFLYERALKNLMLAYVLRIRRCLFR